MAETKRRVALVHDWLTGMRGGERVLEALIDLFPEAAIHTLVYRPERVSEKIRSRRVVTSFIDRLPFAHRAHQIYLPLFPAAVGAFDLGDYDLVVSSSHCVAKGAVTRPETLHICYCHTPMRYAWDFRHLYLEGVRPWPLRLVADLLLEKLRIWDVASAPRVNAWIANSHHVARRIEKYYRAPSQVIHPPVDIDHFRPVDRPTRDCYLVLSALVPYKRVDLAVAAAPRLPRPLKVVGAGPELARLRSLARGNCEFLGERSRAEVHSLLANARALIFPGEEDFGITPVEAAACGTPVVAYARGGALETVIAGHTGVFFANQDVGELGAAVHHLEDIRWDPARMRAHAEHFAPARFMKEMQELLHSLLAEG